MIFSFFWLTLIGLFFINYLKPFLLTVNKCAITIMIIIIDVKSFLQRHFCGIIINSFRKQTLVFVKKKKNSCTSYNYNYSTHCKAKQVLRDLFNINQRNGSGATKINLKNLKALL